VGVVGAVAIVWLMGVKELPENMLGNIMVGGIAVTSWAFVVLYWIRSNWSSTQPGRALMYAMGSLALFTSQVTLTIWTDSAYPFRSEVRALLYSALLLTLVNLVTVLLLSQRKDDGKGDFKWW
jgi:hypothetical protein